MAAKRTVILNEALALRIQEHLQLLEAAADMAKKQGREPGFDVKKVHQDLEELTDAIEHVELSSIENTTEDVARSASVRFRSGEDEIEFTTRQNPGRSYSRWTCDRCGAEVEREDMKPHAQKHFGKA